MNPVASAAASTAKRRFVPRSYFRLTEAAELACCNPEDIVHYAAFGKIDLLLPAPEGLSIISRNRKLAKFDKSRSGPTFLCVLGQECAEIEIYGKTRIGASNCGYDVGGGSMLSFREANEHIPIWTDEFRQREQAALQDDDLYRALRNELDGWEFIFTANLDAESPTLAAIEVDVSMLWISGENLDRFLQYTAPEPSASNGVGDFGSELGPASENQPRNAFALPGGVQRELNNERAIAILAWLLSEQKSACRIAGRPNARAIGEQVADLARKAFGDDVRGFDSFHKKVAEALKKNIDVEELQGLGKK